MQDEDAAPAEFVCPLSHTLMREPVVGSDGQTYERKWIVHWLQQHGTSPVSREPMEATRLVPNYALKSMIDAFLAAHPAAAECPPQSAPAAASPASGAASPPLELMLVAMRARGKVHIQVTPPLTGPRKPTTLICMLDVSGSMGSDASPPQNGSESDGLSRLDLVKHSVNTIIHTLDSADRLAIISFHSHAEIVLPLQQMTEAGRQEALAAVTRLHPDGSANIWDALRVGLEVAGRDPASLVLFTDGEPNVNPPRGIIPTLEGLLVEGRFGGTLHAFGFGYQLDSDLLHRIAELGGGVFGFIPDSSMVGTVFVNFASNALATCAMNLRLVLAKGGGAPLDLHVPSIQYGQTRDFLVDDSDCTAETVSLSSVCGTSLTASVVDVDESDPAFVLQEARHLFMKHILLGLRAPSEAVAIVRQLVDNLRQLSTGAVAGGSPCIDEFLRDAESHELSEGQVMKAFERSDWFKRWGQHYLKSLVRAHAAQQCANFRDKSLQMYGGPLFRELRDAADKLFCRLPAPAPSIAAAGGSQLGPSLSQPRNNMSSYYDASAPCFDGQGDVLLADGVSQKRVCDLQKGDALYGGGRVRCLVETKMQEGQRTRMVPLTVGDGRLGTLWITAWHPVVWEDRWMFPHDISEGEQTREVCVDRIYNLVLDAVHVVHICGVPVVTLGHSFRGPVVGHAYFGSEAVIRDLERVPGWDGGCIQLRSGRRLCQRDPSTLRVSRFVAAEAHFQAELPPPALPNRG